MGAVLALVAVLAALGQEPAAAGAADHYVRFDHMLQRDRIEADGHMERIFEQRVLLRNAAAVAAFGQISTPYVDGIGEVVFESVTIRKPDGRVIEVQGQVEDINPFGLSGTTVAADLRFRKLTVPGLEPGDTLSYRIIRHVKPLAPGWVFGEATLPALVGDPLQTYELDLPRDAAIKVRLRSGLAADWENLEGPADRLVRRLSLRVPQPNTDGEELTKAEAAALSEPDVQFTSFLSWHDVARWWWNLSKSRLKPNDAVKAEAARLVSGKVTAREKVLALHAFVASNVRYLGVSFGVGRMRPRQAADVLASRYGDCKDKHALLSALANAVGIETSPVLAHSQRADLRDDVPSPQQFDHMLTVVRLGPKPEQWLWLDATDSLAVPGQLNPSLRGKRALLVESAGEARLVRLPAELPFVPSVDIALSGSLDADGTLRGHLTWKLRSDREPRLRYLFAVTPPDERPRLVQTTLARAWRKATFTNVSSSDPADLSSPFRVEFDAERPAWKDWPASQWLPLADFDLPDPAKVAQPNQPSVEFPLRAISLRAEMRLPEGMTARAPLSVTLTRSFGHFASRYAVEGGVLRVTRTLDLSRSSLTSEDVASYESFRRAIDSDRGQEFLLSGGAAAATSAQALHEQGLASFDRKEYRTAIELFQRATTADPKLKDGFNDLGRALRGLGRLDEALNAFGRQIEDNPYHESAYAERAYTLMALDRWDEAELDLVKQIEVAPFEAWSHGRLGERREQQGRFAEATDSFARAAALEPKEAERWADLARVALRADRQAEARDALARARQLDPPARLKLDLAGYYAMLADWQAVGALAGEALEPIRKRLLRLSPESFGAADLRRSEQLIGAWSLVGGAALAAGDHPKARRYLEAAWQLGLSPWAASKLDELNRQEGRADEATRLRCMVSEMTAGALPGPSPQTASCPPPGALLQRRTLSLGSASAVLSGEVLLLLDQDGRVRKIRSARKDAAAPFEEMLAHLAPVRLELTPPDDQPFRAVRRGLVACAPTSGCSLILDLPGQRDSP